MSSCRKGYRINKTDYPFPGVRPVKLFSCTDVIPKRRRRNRFRRLHLFSATNPPLPPPPAQIRIIVKTNTGGGFFLSFSQLSLVKIYEFRVKSSFSRTTFERRFLARRCDSEGGSSVNFPVPTKTTRLSF